MHRPLMSPVPTDNPLHLRIDCDDCIRQYTDSCDDCVVTFLCTREADDAVVIDVAEVRALHLLGEAGLAPKLRHQRRTG